MTIHATAIVNPKAKINSDVDIGPHVFIDQDVTIGSGVKIQNGASVSGRTTIGEHTEIYPGAVIGYPAQMKSSKVIGSLVIGKRNVIREYVTIHASSTADGTTVIGDDNYFMGFAHVGHDCKLANNIVVVNGTLLAGYVVVEDRVFLSGNTAVHQFVRIGELAMIGGLSRVTKDVPPYMLANGNSLIWSINTVGLRRAGFSQDIIRNIRKAYVLLYRSDLNVSQALEKIKELPANAQLQHLVEFISGSKRGISAHARTTTSDAWLVKARVYRPMLSYGIFQKIKRALQYERS